MDAQRQIIEEFKRDLPDILAGNDRYFGPDAFKFFRPDAKPKCEVGGCDRPKKARGMCQKHYHRWWYRQSR